MFNKVKNLILEKNPFETIVGILIVLVAVWFLFYALVKVDFSTEGYRIEASFARIGGVNVGTDVRINGIKIGNVVKMNLDEESYRAILVLTIKSGIKIPDDSTVSIASDGIVGSNYVKINLGNSSDHLKPREKLRGDSYKSLEDMVGDLIFSFSGRSGDSK
jgi:phospholipid/cholesterol/gamma-HCH transport system substrate-binding protein